MYDMDRSMQTSEVFTSLQSTQTNGMEVKSGNGGRKSSEEKLTENQRLLLHTFREERGSACAARKLNVSAKQTQKNLRNIRKKLGVLSNSDLLCNGDVLKVDEKTTKQTVTARSLLELIEKQQFMCALSGELLTPETASLDHKIPISKGGEHSLDNVAWVHRSINAAKGTMTIDEFILVCRKVTAYLSPP